MKQYYKVKVTIDGLNADHVQMYLVACDYFTQWAFNMGKLYLGGYDNLTITYKVVCKESHDLFGAKYVRL